MTSATGKRSNSDEGGKRSASDWMKGVQIEPESADLSMSSDSGNWNMKSLGTELSKVGQKFPNVEFEPVNVTERKCTISLSGPWGTDDEIAFVRLHLEFPDEYPESKPPLFELEETAGVSNSRRKDMTKFLVKIGGLHAQIGRPCMESYLRYLVGEKSENAKWRVRREGESDVESDTEATTTMEEILIMSANICASTRGK